jgi:hypothetical protein
MFVNDVTVNDVNYSEKELKFFFDSLAFPTVATLQKNYSRDIIHKHFPFQPDGNNLSCLSYQSTKSYFSS